MKLLSGATFFAKILFVDFPLSIEADNDAVKHMRPRRTSHSKGVSQGLGPRAILLDDAYVERLAFSKEMGPQFAKYPQSNSSDGSDHCQKLIYIICLHCYCY